jgi:tetratricopeptide (TPR) repeat protein
MTDTTADALHDAARAHEAGLRYPEAATAWQAYLAARPVDGNAWYNLGRVLRRMRRLDDALDAYAEALRQGAADPWEVHLTRGVILSDDLLRPEEARVELETALTLNPAYVPAWLNLGNLHEDQGRREPARDAYQRALALRPDDPMALSRLAGLVPEPVGADEPMIGRLREAVTAVRGQDVSAMLDRADLGFALGRLLDSSGAYDEAFAAYRLANNASAATGAGRGVRYDRAATEAVVDKLIAIAPPPLPPIEDDGPAPVFICGMFRSGSTLAERILAAHSQASAGGEMDLLPAIARNAFNPFPEALAVLDADSRRKLRDAYLGGLRERVAPALVMTDKRPDNILYLSLAKALFPKAKIIHTVRDPMDNCLSVYFLHLSMAYAQDLEDTAHWLAQERRLAAHWKTLWPDDVHTVDYDALVADPEPAVRDLLAFCGLDWEPGVMDFHTRGGPVRTASVWQVREPLYQRSSGRWRNYEAHLGGLRKALEGYGLID